MQCVARRSAKIRPIKSRCIPGHGVSLPCRRRRAASSLLAALPPPRPALQAARTPYVYEAPHQQHILLLKSTTPTRRFNALEGGFASSLLTTNCYPSTHPLLFIVKEAAMAEEGKSNGVQVCVTGGASFIGSWLVRKLLERGYTVHATLRNTGDEEKAGLLRRLVPGAAERLRLFEADLFDAASFAPAIAGCQFVFLVATPFVLESASSKYKNTAEAAMDAVRAILRLCAESKTVKRVIHTASISTASPLKEVSGAGYRDFISESCWTSLNVDYPLRSAHFDKYILSKLQSEQELLSYNDGEHPAFEVVTLALALVAGDTVLGRAPETLEWTVSPVSGNELYFGLLRLLQRLLGSVALVHVDDVCDALVFCMERPSSIAGRFLCAAAYPSVHDIVDHYAKKFPHLDVLKETEAVARVQPDVNKLGELGFRYKYGMEEILDRSVACAARLGCLDAAKLSSAQSG